MSVSAALNRLQAELSDGVRRWFRAPGRVNLMGDHTDYNDGFVLPMAIDLDCVVAASPRRDAVIHGVSLDLPGERSFDRYVQAVAQALAQRGLPPVGVDAVLASDVPPGAGLSSSAAIEVALGLALCDAGGLVLADRELALACQDAEHRATGVPSGIMDQLASLGGKAGHALLIDCRSLEWEHVSIPDELEMLVVHSGVSRTLAASAYAERRRECERFARSLGAASLRDIAEGQARGHALARHVLTENERVHETADALRRGDVDQVGALFNESHASLRDDFQVSTPELDLLVSALVAAGSVGARMTGAGFGGAVVAACRTGTSESVSGEAAVRYRAAVGLDARAWVVHAVDGAGRLEL